MKLLVTGGAGFIGSNFVHYWNKHHPEDQVSVYDAWLRGSNPRNLEGTKCRVYTGNILDQEVTDQLVDLHDMVIHFAADTHVDNSIKDSRPFVTNNVLGTATLLDAIVKYGKRFHHVSTDEVYGALGSTGAFSESSQYAPRNPYAASKAGSDHLVMAYYHTHGANVTMSHCSNNYGPRQSTDKFIPKVITNALSDQKIPVYGKGANVRDWLYVEDHCSALEKILLHGKPGESYCIGGGTELSNNQVVKKILRFTGKPSSLVEYVPDRKGHDYRYAIDHSKLQETLGWEPSTTFDSGLIKTIRWYLEEKKEKE